MIAQQMRKQYQQLAKKRSLHQSQLITPRQNSTLRHSFHDLSSSKSRVQYNDYLESRKQTQSTLLCCNCINDENMKFKQMEHYLRKQEDQSFYKNVNNDLQRQLSVEQQLEKQKKSVQKEILSTNYKDHINYKQQLKQQEQQLENKYIEEVLRKDKHDREIIKQEIQNEIDKKIKFQRDIEIQLQQQKQIKRNQTEINDNWFIIGDDQKHQLLKQQKKEQEKLLLRKQRDEQIKQKQQKIQEYQIYQKQIEKKIAEDAAKYDIFLKNQEQRNKEQQKKEFIQYLDRVVKEHQEKQHQQQVKEDFEAKKHIQKINQENEQIQKNEQLLQETKRKKFIDGLSEQVNLIKKQKTQEKEFEKNIDKDMIESGRKYDFLRKYHETPLLNSCGRCKKSYEQKQLTKVTNS